MATERNSLFLFLISIFSFSFFYMTEGVFSFYERQYTGNTYKNMGFMPEKHSSKKNTISLSFDVKKDNFTKRNSRPEFCKKTSRSIFQDMIVRNADNAFHFKSFVQLLHRLEYKKSVVYNDLFPCYALNRNVFIQHTDYYIYTLRKIIT